MQGIMLSRINIGRHVIMRCLSANTTSNANAKYMCQIAGLSRFASRRDALMCCGGIEPLKVEAVIDRSYFPTGKFIITVASMEDLEKLKSHQNNIRPLTFTDLKETEYQGYNTTSRHNISMRTLRIELTHNASCTKDDVHFFFREYQVVSIRAIDSTDRESPITSGHNSLYLVDFESAEDAERAVQTKINQIMFVGKVKLIWYSC